VSPLARRVCYIGPAIRYIGPAIRSDDNHAPEQTHNHPASRLVTDRTVGPNRGFQPQELKDDWVSPGIPYITMCPGLPIAPG
jgi:hypothetical protein